MIGFVDTAWPAVLRLGGAVLQLLTTIIIARLLGAEVAGVYFFWTAAMMEAGHIAPFGLDSLSLRQVPRLREDPKKVARFLATVRMIAVLLGLFFAGGLIAYSLLTQGDSQPPGWWYWILPAGVLGIAFTLINGEAMAGLGHPVLAIFYRHTLAVVSLLLCVGLLGIHLTEYLAIAAYAFAFMISGFGALAGPVLRKFRPAVGMPTWKETRELLWVGCPIFLAGTFMGMTVLIPLAILERTHSATEVALLTTAFRIFVLFDVLAKAVQSRKMPDLSRAALSPCTKKLRSIYFSATGMGMLVLGAPILGVFLFASQVMKIFGPEFAEGGSTLMLFMIFAAVSLVLGPARQMILMVGHTRQMAIFSLITCLVASGLALLVVPEFGAVGLAFVLGCGILLERILYIGFALWSNSRNKKETIGVAS